MVKYSIKLTLWFKFWFELEFVVPLFKIMTMKSKIHENQTDLRKFKTKEKSKP